jgi:hypothetical protein
VPKYGFTLAEQWLSYAAMIPRSASRAQWIETRRGFYAGAQAVFAIMSCLSEGTDGDGEPTEADGQIVGALQAELEQFVEDVRKGEA